MQLGRDRSGERLGGGSACGAELRGEAVDLALRGRERLGRRGGRINAAGERVELGLGLGGPGEQLGVVGAAEAALRLGDPVEFRLDLLEPAGLGLEARQERTQLARGLAEP